MVAFTITPSRAAARLNSGVRPHKEFFAMLRAFLLAAALLLLPGHSSARMFSGQHLNEWITSHETENGSKFESGLLLGYVSGIVDLGDGHLFCLPSGVNGRQYIAVVIKYHKEHPELWNRSGDLIVTNALKGAFPCSPKK